jgi:2,3-bisphosphoglycerate-dependent phosphoglycerate mutase
VKLLLVRHAESVGNAERRLQGQGDFPLSERGIGQAQRLAQRLAAESPPPVALYASPLLRTSQTADIVSDAIGLPVETVDDLREYDFGEVSGLTWSEIGERYPELVQAVRSRTPEYPVYPGEEGRPVFKERVCSAIDDLCQGLNPDSAVVVVTHAGPIVVTCLNVLGLPYQRPAAFAVDNCSITTIEVSDGRSVLISTNDVCHLMND